MSKDETITLITLIDEKKDESGFVISENTKKIEIFCSVKDSVRSEFYEALRNGIKASIVFTVDGEDFKLSEHIIRVNGTERKRRAEKVEYNGIVFRIVRSFRVTSDDLELTCEEVE